MDAVTIRNEYCSVASTWLTLPPSPVRPVINHGLLSLDRTRGVNVTVTLASQKRHNARVAVMRKFPNGDVDKRRRCQMTLEAREDIIERALLCLLAPAPAPAAAALVKKKKLRLTKTLLSEAAKEKPRKELMPARISIIEWLSSVTLSVCWSDSTTGYFGDQVWRMGLAHGRSFCALSGMPIKIGDSVFRPWVSETRAPANSHRMILASCVRVPSARR